MLFGVAGHGNIDPRVCVQADAAEAEKMGRELAEIVRRALPQLQPIEMGTLCAHREPWSVTRTRTLDQAADEQFMRLIRAGDVHDSEVMAVRAGDLAIVGLPGEALSEITAAIREASPFAHTRVLSCANDFVGYIPTDEAQRQGAHETNCAPAEGMEGPVLAKAVAALRALT